MQKRKAIPDRSGLMRVLRCLFCLCMAFMTSHPARGDIADDFLKGYILIQEGDASEKGGEKEAAVEKYSGALKVLRKVARSSPDWNPNIIAYRMKYCAEHVIKNGGKVEAEEVDVAAGPGASTAETTASQPAEPAPINTVPTGISPSGTDMEKPLVSDKPLVADKPVTAEKPPPAIEPPPSDKPPAVEKSAPTESSTSLERELEKAYTEAREAPEPEGSDSEIVDLRKRLRKAEDQLRAAMNLGDERIQSLTKENRALKAELADLQGQMQTLQRDYDSLKTEREALKRDLEKTQLQLKTTLARGVSSDELQTLQRENSLLRAITERQYQEEQKRIEAGKRVAKYVQELESQLEMIVRPTALSEQEIAAMKHSPGKDKDEDADKEGGDTRLVGTIKAEGDMREGGFLGKIVQVNGKEKFVIVNFYPGDVPPVTTIMNVYRGNSQVGTVKISNPTKPPVAPAEVIKGSLRRGDLVRKAGD